VNFDTENIPMVGNCQHIRCCINATEPAATICLPFSEDLRCSECWHGLFFHSVWC